MNDNNVNLTRIHSVAFSVPAVFANVASVLFFNGMFRVTLMEQCTILNTDGTQQEILRPVSAFAIPLENAKGFVGMLQEAIDKQTTPPQGERVQ